MTNLNFWYWLQNRAKIEKIHVFIQVQFMDKNSNLAPVCYVGFSYCRVEGKIEFIAGDLLILQALLLVQDLIEMLAGQLGWKCKIWGNVR